MDRTAKFAVWAVCKPDGSHVAYYHHRDRAEAEKAAKQMTASDSRAAIGAFFVQPAKVKARV